MGTDRQVFRPAGNHVEPLNSKGILGQELIGALQIRVKHAA
jgi:hypothetical protein